MLVIKFGGTSVGSPDGVEKIVDILSDEEHRGKTGVVVVSAFSGVTDKLILLAKKALAGGTAYKDVLDELKQRHHDMAGAFFSGKELENVLPPVNSLLDELAEIIAAAASKKQISAETHDLVLSFGERLSAFILTAVFCNRNIDAVFLDTRSLVKTDDHFGKANFIAGETYSRINAWHGELAGRAADKKPPLVVATGFIASTMDGRTTTLGRGGSDLTASIFGAALGSGEVEIWTDVDGILTADPRHVKNAFLVESISYEEAMELSHFGAKVIYLPTIKPALEKDIPIRIKNTFNKSCEGTLVVKEPEASSYLVRGISSMNDVALVRIQGSGMVGVAGFSARLFGALARRGINIILITQSSSEYSICFAVLPSDAEAAGEAVRAEFESEIRLGTIDPPIVETDFSVIAAVGSNMRNTPGISGKFFHSLGRNGISVSAIAQGSSEINISAVILRRNQTKALNAVHEAFFLSSLRSVNVFLVGTGLIGSTLLDQIAGNRDKLAEEYKIRINIVGAADYGKMLLCLNGLDPKRTRALLRKEDTLTEDDIKRDVKLKDYALKDFIAEMKAFNLPNACFCDCTASDEVAAAYYEVLSSSISVVTPNKRANAGAYEYYRNLKDFSRNRGIPFLYETNVCAGLPVISTLRDLFLSGDRIRRIEAVLSGTLSFIFNNFDGGKKFSALVREAKAKGYTEPDPREDLNAMDAARKALILARECGVPIEFSDVEIEPILPAACFEAESVDAFFAELEKADGDFEKRRSSAAAAGRALRYVALVEDGRAKLALREESPGSPFLSLTDADNIVVITTDRYSKLPMVIKGPGAGAQVTAGGIYADILRIARTLV